MYGRFRFHPVGQGLFYTGSIPQAKKERLYNFVYDCGAAYDFKARVPKRELPRAIGNHIAYLKKNDPQKLDKPIIDFVVISHFDYDHFSGLFGLKRETQIKKFYFPYIGDPKSPFVWYAFDKLLYNDDFIQTGDPQIIHAMRELYDNGNIVEEGGEDKGDRNEGEEKAYIIRNHIGSCSFLDEKKLWKFHLFNKKVDPQLIINFNAQVFSTFGTNDIETLTRNAANSPSLNTIRKQLNIIYKNVFGSSNITSLVLTHYPMVSAYTEVNCNFYPYPKCWRCSDLSTLGAKECCKPCGGYCGHHCGYSKYKYYNAWGDTQVPAATTLTGDAEFDQDMINTLTNILRNQKFHLRILQVPHHGSNKNPTFNWDSLGALKLVFDWYVIPFGFGNTYGLPDSSVIADLQHNYKNFAYATQRDYFEYRVCF